MATVQISTVDFLNSKTPEESIARLGMAGLPSGVSPAALSALVKLTCQAHDIHMPGMRPDYEDHDLRELKSMSYIHWTGGDKVSLV